MAIWGTLSLAKASWRRPKNVTELRSFLGFASYYRRFVEGFAKLAGPLHRLVAELGNIKPRKGSGQALGAAWTSQCEDSFEALKSRLVSAFDPCRFLSPLHPGD